MFVVFVYSCSTNFNMFPVMPFCIKLHMSNFLSTRSNAFLKSTNAQYVSLVSLNLFLIMLVNPKIWWWQERPALNPFWASFNKFSPSKNLFTLALIILLRIFMIQHCNARPRYWRGFNNSPCSFGIGWIIDLHHTSGIKLTSSILEKNVGNSFIQSARYSGYCENQQEIQ